MSRKDENKRTLEIIDSTSLDRGTYEELVINNLGSIAGLLVDISKSLAVIADALDEGGTDAIR